MVDFALKEYLEEHAISLHWVHEKTGIRYATLLSMANKQVTKINLKHLHSIMSALNIKDMNLLFKR